ncbi:MAG: DedD protein [Gammaproteobacteria bacterium]|nr:DedD protein [Gammaproteobacteria bacterium]
MDRRVKERLVGATILVVLIVLIVPELLSGPKSRMTPAPPPSAAGPVEAVRNVTVDLATSKATSADTAASAASPSEEGTPAAAGAAGPPGDVAPGDAAAPGEVLTPEPAPDKAPGGVPALTSRATRPLGSPTIATLKAQQPAHSAQSELDSEPSTPRSAPKASKPGNANDAAAAGAPTHHWAVQLGSFASRANAEKLVRQLKPRDASLYVSSSGKGASLRYRVRIGPLADRDAAERVMAKLKKEGQSASLVAP